MKRWQRIVLHALLVAAWFVANGYSFGLVDHVLHLPFLDLARNPGFLAHDYLLGHTSHPSLFWLLQVPLVAWFRIEYVYVAIHIVSVWTLIGGMVALTRALYPGPSEEQAGWLAASLAVVGCMTFAGIPTLDALVLNRTVVLGAELWALTWAVRGRAGWAFLICGLAFDIHPTTAVHTAILVFAIGMWRPQSRRRTILAMPWFIVAAAPLLIHSWRTGHGSVPWPAPADWFTIVSTAYPFHHFAQLLSPFQYLCFALPLAVMLVARRFRPQPMLDALAVTCIAVSVIHVLVTSVLHWPISIQLHLLEITRFLPLMACAAVGGLLVANGPADTRARWVLALGFAAFSACSMRGSEDFALWRESIVPCVLLLICALLPARADAEPNTWRWSHIAICAVALAGGTFAIRSDLTFHLAFSPGKDRVGEYVGFAQLPVDEVSGVAVMKWSKSHLPQDAIVATPPYFDHPLTAFRHNAGLSMVGTFKDGGEATFDYAFAKQWQARMLALCGLKDFFDRIDPPGWWWSVNKERCLNGWRWADTSRIRALRTRFDATHVIVETQLHHGSIDLPVVYADSAFIIYRIEF